MNKANRKKPAGWQPRFFRMPFKPPAPNDNPEWIHLQDHPETVHSLSGEILKYLAPLDPAGRDAVLRVCLEINKPSLQWQGRAPISF